MYYIPAVPSCLHIWQLNTRKSQMAQHHILNTDPSLFNLILIQEPWINTFGNARGNHCWWIIYPSNQHVTNHPTIRSIMLVNANIFTNSYTTLNIPSNDIMAIHLKGTFRFCSVFNIYNDCTNNNTTDMLKTYLDANVDTVLPSPRDHIFWFGNFNCHHPQWEEDRNHHLFNSDELIDPLPDLITDHNVMLTLPLGIPTYKMAQGNWTRPDNIWRSNNPTDPIITCDTTKHMPHADHLPIVTELDLTIQCATSIPTRDMRKANFNTINRKLCTKLDAQHPTKQIQHREEVEAAADSLVTIIKETLDKEVPISRPSAYAKCWWISELTKLKKEKNRLSNLSYKL